MTVRKHKVLAGFLAAALAVLLSGCGCEHDWQKATCQNPRTCSLCGKTEGKVRSHDWGSTVCYAPSGCVVCGTTEGMELTHEWQDDCRICIHCGRDERPADDRFPELLRAGLEARFALEQQQKARGSELTGADWEERFDAEYDQVGLLAQETFRDEALGSAALNYIDSIRASMDALEYYGTERWEDEYYSGAYQERSAALYQIHALCPITVAEAYREELDVLLVNGEIIQMVSPLLRQVRFLHIDTDGEEKTYETTLENTTTLTFAWFSLDVRIRDEQGNVLDTQNVKVSYWKPEEKKRFRFVTEADADVIEVAFANWQLPS